MSGGMDLRDYFAGQAMMGVWSDYLMENAGCHAEENEDQLKMLASACYKIADAMIAERRNRDVAKDAPVYHDVGGEQWIEMKPGECRTANTRYKFRNPNAGDKWDLIHPATIGIALTESSCTDYVFIRPLTRGERKSL